LRGVRKGDKIAMTGSRGRLWYRVDAISVVAPDQIEVLRAGSGERLTLITCYPFNYLGSAPQRYIVRAERTQPFSNDDSPARFGSRSLVSQASEHHRPAFPN
jgi:sortase A